MPGSDWRLWDSECMGTAHLTGRCSLCLAVTLSLCAWRLMREIKLGTERVPILISRRRPSCMLARFGYVIIHSAAFIIALPTMASCLISGRVLEINCRWHSNAPASKDVPGLQNRSALERFVSPKVNSAGRCGIEITNRTSMCVIFTHTDRETCTWEFWQQQPQ